MNSREPVSDESLERYQEQLQHLVMDLGRDDIGVGDIRAVDGTLQFTLTSGPHVHSGQIPVRALDDTEGAKDALTAILLPMSKAIEKERLRVVRGAAGD